MKTPEGCENIVFKARGSFRKIADLFVANTAFVWISGTCVNMNARRNDLMLQIW